MAVVGCTQAERTEEPDVGSESQPGQIGDEGEEVGEDDGFCENGPLYFGPASLPQASLGEPYVVSLHDYAEPGWHGVGYSMDFGAPPGLEIPDRTSAVIEGIPEEEGYYTFDVEASHAVDDNGCSTIPDPHEFTMFVGPADVGTSTGSSGEATTTTEGSSSSASSATSGGET